MFECLIIEDPIINFFSYNFNYLNLKSCSLAGLFVNKLFQEYFFCVAIFEALKLLSNNDLEKYIQ